MSLDKAIEHGKEHREPYRGAKAIDATCRNHGGCPWCEGNRKFKMRDKHPELPEDERAAVYTVLESVETVASMCIKEEE